jgi:hypothetical protein
MKEGGVARAEQIAITNSISFFKQFMNFVGIGGRKDERD